MRRESAFGTQHDPYFVLFLAMSGVLFTSARFSLGVERSRVERAGRAMFGVGRRGCGVGYRGVARSGWRPDSKFIVRFVAVLA
jgi:hypothetical protein